MSCRRVRRILARPAEPGPTERTEVSDHLAACSECRRLAAELERVRGSLEGHHAGVRPDAGFAAGVLERVAREDAHRAGLVDDLGWAALRLLPAAVLLAGALSWPAFRPSGAGLALLLPQPDDGTVAAFVVSGLDESEAVTP